MANENSTTVTPQGGLKFVRVFDAPKALVWKAWSDPELMKQWWGPRGWSSPAIEQDFRVGGKYLLAMRGRMGPGQPEVTTWSGGTYREIIPMEKIAVLDHFADEHGNKIHASQYGLPASFPMESVIEIEFADAPGGKTKLTLHYPSIKGIEGGMLTNMQMGWNQSLDKLAEKLTDSNN